MVLLNENLSNLEESSRTSINSLISDTSDTRKSLKILENVMKKKINEQDNIQSIIQPFYEEVKPQFHILENLLKKTEASFKKCAEYFCEDSRKIQSDEFSGFLYNFKKQCID